MTDREPTVIAKTVTRTVVPLITVTAVALLLQGHNLPGGGFIAGVLTTTAFALLYVVYGVDSVRHDLVDTDGEGSIPILEGPTGEYARGFAVGLAIAVAAGIGSILLGVPFLTQGVVFLEGVPVYGEFEIASALAFDVGVYFVVVGALLTVLSVVGEE
ncbi:MAG: MnhB domain-containing protein [Haloarculaceae archaeon]